jgi:hypothetical protein
MQAAEQEGRQAMAYDALGEFNDAFTSSYAAEQARQDAISAALVQDTLHPARRDEDRLARAGSHAAEGVYDTPPAVAFASQRAAIELASATGRAPCGPADAMGRCGARYHAFDCQHGQTVDWLASGPPRETYEAALANTAAGFNLSGTPLAIWDDPDDLDDPDGAPATVIPFQTVELAHQLAHDWGLFDDSPFASAPAYDDLMRPPGAPVTAYDAMAESIGYGSQPPVTASYPGIRELAERLQLR